MASNTLQTDENIDKLQALQLVIHLNVLIYLDIITNPLRMKINVQYILYKIW